MNLTIPYFLSGFVLLGVPTLSQASSQNLSENIHGAKVLIDEEAEVRLLELQESNQAIAAGATTTIYLNRNGGVFGAAQRDDSGTNQSSLVQSGAVDFPSSDLSSAEWTQVVACVEDLFSAYNVNVTTSDPGSAPHVEAVVSGSPGLLNQPGNVGGLAPFTRSCTVIPNAIVYIFPETLGGDPQVVCEVVAQEVAHSFGLDHEYLCEDPMSYLQNCGPKTFQNQSARCGEYEARDCVDPSVGRQWDCGRSEQNSVQLLTERLGPADTSGPKPNTTDPGDVIGGCSTSGGQRGGLLLLLAALGLSRRSRVH